MGKHGHFAVSGHVHVPCFTDESKSTVSILKWSDH